MTAVPQLARRSRRGEDDRRASHLRLVTPAPTRHTRLLSALLALIAAVMVFGTVAVNALGAADAIEARGLQAEVADAERRYAVLVAEVARLEHPGRIEQIATEELGMVAPTDAHFLVLDRTLPEDRRGTGEVVAGDRTDPLKPVLSVER